MSWGDWQSFALASVVTAISTAAWLITGSLAVVLWVASAFLAGWVLATIIPALSDGEPGQ